MYLLKTAMNRRSEIVLHSSKDYRQINHYEVAQRYTLFVANRNKGKGY
jgi:hypothetical protein